MSNTTQQTTLTSSNDDDITTTQSNNSNRLAPYNPTHATAQSKALDLLSLTSSDIFFDLGCGDGRLIIAAIEKCYDDDYLLKVHQERFSKLELYPHEDTSPTGSTSPPQQLSQPPVRRDVHTTNNEANDTPPRRSGTTATHQLDTNTPSSISSSRKSIQHTGSHSDYSVPHLMRTSSQDDDSECLSSFDTPSTAYRREMIPPSPHVTSSASNKNIARTQESVDENGSLEDVLSAISPLDQQLQYQYTSSRKGARIPDSPITPIANNRRLNKVTLPLRNYKPPLMPHDNDKPEQQQNHVLLNESSDISDSIPKTIETPACSPDGDPKHVVQISELPTDLSNVVGDVNDDVQEENGGEEEEIHPLLSSGYPLNTIPSNDQIDNASSKKKKSSTNNDDTAMGKSAAAQDNTINTSGITTGSESESGFLGDGLRCVGIEYNQALAESAQINVSKSYIYPHVEKKVCIRWGDVLDEWNRGEQQTDEAEEVYMNNRDDDNHKYDSWNDHDGGEGNNKNDASKLTLLNDATAVFVYLLPQGLKKVKPLLYEAAVRRKRQRDQFLQCKQQQQQQQIQEQRPQHPLHPHLLQQPSIEKEPSSETLTEDSTEFIPFPPKHLIQHRKGSSHVSDITDCDFRKSDEFNNMATRMLDKVDDVQQSRNNMTNVRRSIPPPAFRVVSYMFAVPGWEATKVDRTSKGSCPLYLYENIHEFGMNQDEVEENS